MGQIIKPAGGTTWTGGTLNFTQVAQDPNYNTSNLSAWYNTWMLNNNDQYLISFKGQITGSGSNTGTLIFTCNPITFDPATTSIVLTTDITTQQHYVNATIANTGQYAGLIKFDFDLQTSCAFNAIIFGTQL
jgi:hypothetical protein